MEDLINALAFSKFVLKIDLLGSDAKKIGLFYQKFELQKNQFDEEDYFNKSNQEIDNIFGKKLEAHYANYLSSIISENEDSLLERNCSIDLKNFNRMQQLLSENYQDDFKRAFDDLSKAPSATTNRPQQSSVKSFCSIL